MSALTLASAVQGMVARAPAPSMQATSSLRKAEWNPQGVAIPGAVPEYLKNAPAYLDGSLAGDVGFDPLCLAVYSWPVFQEKGLFIFGTPKPGLILNLPDLSAEQRVQVFGELTSEEQRAAVLWMREAELKHARLAMLAAVGWPLGELVNWGFLHSWGDLNGRTPSLFNGGLMENYAPFWLLFLAAASYLELSSVEGGVGANGDYKFDPLSMGKGSALAEMQLKEIKNGRLAMMAITGFAVQECLWGSPVVEQTGIFFGRF